LQIEGAHKIAALLFRSAELAISSEDSKKLALSIKNLAQFYEISPNPKTIAWFQLLTIAASIYVPRVGLIAMRKANEKRQRQQQMQMQNPVAPQGPKVQAGQPPQETPGVYKYQ